MADLLRRPAPNLLLLLDIKDGGAGEYDTILPCDIFIVIGAFSNSSLCMMLLFAELVVVCACKLVFLFLYSEPDYMK